MRSRTTDRFRDALAALPPTVRKQAVEAYRRFIDNPLHPGLQFKRVHTRRQIYSVRIGVHYRALGVLHDDEVIWFWIGSHADYDALLSGL